MTRRSMGDPGQLGQTCLAGLLLACGGSFEPVEGTWQGTGALDGVIDGCEMAPNEPADLALELERSGSEEVEIHFDYWPRIFCDIDRNELSCDPSSFEEPIGLSLWANELYSLRLSGELESSSSLAASIEIQRRCDGVDCDALGDTVDCDTSYSLTFEALSQ